MKDLVIKIGGSLMYNDDMRLNELFLNKFKSWYTKHRKNIGKLAITVGGGKLSRQMGNSIKGIVNVTELHGVAMQITQVNAEILRGTLSDKDIVVPQTLGEAFDALSRPLDVTVISGGLKEGWSTDMDAASFADALNVKTIYKLSNVEGVYTSDPKKDLSAKKIENISWEEYFNLFDISSDSTHKPNSSSPVSVETAVFSRQKGFTFFVSGGNKIYEKEDLSLVFESGTKIHP